MVVYRINLVVRRMGNKFSKKGRKGSFYIVIPNIMAYLFDLREGKKVQAIFDTDSGKMIVKLR